MMNELSHMMDLLEQKGGNLSFINVQLFIQNSVNNKIYQIQLSLIQVRKKINQRKKRKLRNDLIFVKINF